MSVVNYHKGAFWSCLAAFSLSLPIATVAPVTVTNLNDSGPGSLRQAIASGAPGEAIIFAVTGSISLTSGALVISRNLIIDGPGQALLAVSGSGTSGVFDVGPGITVEIEGVTIRDGFKLVGSGAGILNRGTLTLVRCAVRSNQIHSLSSSGGGGISNVGTLTLSGCEVAGNLAHIVADGGGGILNDGSLRLTSSSVMNNATEGGSGGGATDGPDGGGILNRAAATLVLTSSLVSANSADGEGGGIRNEGGLTSTDSTLSFNVSRTYGGGLSNVSAAHLTGCTLWANWARTWGGGAINWGSVSAALTLTNCTVSGNLTDTLIGGGVSNFSTTTLSHTTVMLNTSGLENLGVLNAKNCIVAGNSIADCNEVATATGGRNYHSDGSCGVGFTLATLAQLRLGGLAMNGGPTATHALRPGSVALNAALDCTDFLGAAVLTDQRGVLRPQGPACDVGSFERESDAAPGTPGVR